MSERCAFPVFFFACPLVHVGDVIEDIGDDESVDRILGVIFRYDLAEPLEDVAGLAPVASLLVGPGVAIAPPDALDQFGLDPLVPFLVAGVVERAAALVGQVELEGLEAPVQTAVPEVAVGVQVEGRLEVLLGQDGVAVLAKVHVQGVGDLSVGQPPGRPESLLCTICHA